MRLALELGVALAACFAAVWVTHRSLLDAGVVSPALSVALAFAFVQSLAIAALACTSVVTKIIRQVHQIRTERLDPLIRRRIADHLSGVDRTAWLRAWWRNCPQDIELCMLDFLNSLEGEQLVRLQELAYRIGLVDGWRQQTRSRSPEQRQNAIAGLGLVGGAGAQHTLISAITDPDEQVRLEAARGLVRAGEAARRRVFDFACRERLIERLSLIEELRPHALELGSGAIVQAVESGERARVRFALEAASAWRCLLPAPIVTARIRDSDADIRRLALGLIHPSDDDAVAARVLAALNDPDEGVREAAALAAVRVLHLEALTALDANLRAATGSGGLAAARALARLEPEGWRVLEREIVQGGPGAASAALEALEKARIGRLEQVGRR